MFGFSFPKIIFLIFIILLVWQIFKIIEKKNKLKNNLSSSDERENDNYEVLMSVKTVETFIVMMKMIICPVCRAKNK